MDVSDSPNALNRRVAELEETNARLRQEIVQLRADHVQHHSSSIHLSESADQRLTSSSSSSSAVQLQLRQFTSEVSHLNHRIHSLQASNQTLEARLQLIASGVFPADSSSLTPSVPVPQPIIAVLRDSIAQENEQLKTVLVEQNEHIVETSTLFEQMNVEMKSLQHQLTSKLQLVYFTIGLSCYII
jgi:DNA repair exonuclease SbcCD ATPase subunit